MTAGSFVLRELAGGDFDRWLELWEGYNAFYGRRGPSVLPAEITETTWRRLLDPAEPMFAFVADTDGALVGLAHYLFHLSSTSVAPACYLRDLYTLPSARNRGVGAALIDRVCEEARRAGSSSVYWQAHENNGTARRLYDKVAQRSGFIIYQKTMQLP